MQRSASSPSRLYCSSFAVSVLNFTTSPNSGVKFLGGFLRSESRFFALFSLAVRRFLGFLFFFLPSSPTDRRSTEIGCHRSGTSN